MKPLVVLCAFAIAACSHVERDASRCQSYGWRPGTDSFAACMENQDNTRRAAVLGYMGMRLAVPHTASTYGGVTNAW